ncbi:ubiquitin carboxyl-terminal hydrolase 37 isoform X1 [Brachionus plicatilis]|uniref:ubiquitinyl hydrolase 1 n=1 Tax=Brachionus plicatilis TaxID=10195 RepID=A0A3M7RFL2_BRAPC|nr:ubiquitin carboxyl-terminal hydrolase 37 isoform X1 [Brachionus plicatilis]
MHHTTITIYAIKSFSNLGNTCYMNSILQCLLNIDTFSLELLKSYDKIKSLQIKEISDQNLNEDQIILLETEQNYLFDSLCELVKARELHNEDLKIKSLRDVKNTISKEATRFSGYQQHGLMPCHLIPLADGALAPDT